MELTDFKQQQREYPFLWYVQQFMHTHLSFHLPPDALFIEGELPTDEEFGDLRLLGMKAIVAECHTEDASRSIGTSIIGSNDFITQLVWTLLSRQICIPDEAIVKPGDLRIPMVPAEKYENRKYLKTIFTDRHAIRPVVFSKLYNGFIAAEGIPQLKANFAIGAKVECQFLKGRIPYHVNHTDRPYWSFDKESVMATVKSVNEDDHGNKFTVVEFINKKMQEYLPYPFDDMREILYINGVLVGAPSNSRTLFVMSPE